MSKTTYDDDDMAEAQRDGFLDGQYEALEYVRSFIVESSDSLTVDEVKEHVSERIDHLLYGKFK